MIGAVVGAFARIDAGNADLIRSRLARLPGVEPFDLDRPGALGLLIEAPDLDGAHALLTGDIRAVDGVLAAWPIYAHFDGGAPPPVPPDDAMQVPAAQGPEGAHHGVHTT